MEELGSGEEELRQLMAGYQNADTEAVEELVRRLSPVLLRYFSGPEPTRSEGEDLLQECWMRIHRSRHTYRASEPLLPWIFAIARHTRLDGFRRRKRRQMRETLVAEVPEKLHATGQPELGANERFAMLMAELPESQREVIVMLKVTGMSLEEVARATGTTVGAVKQKAHRAYEKLRRLLSEGGKGGSGKP